MQTVWYIVLGTLIAGYFVLAGYDYGIGLLLHRAGSPSARRAALNAVGPFFLGNEVWIIAALGVLFGAFPALEGELLSSLYAQFVFVLLGLIAVMATVQLRSRARSPQARLTWDRLIRLACAVAATGWGAVLGGWISGGSPLYTLACALTFALLAMVHGAAFLTMRLPADGAARFAAAGSRLVLPALAAVAVTATVGLLLPGVREAVRHPVVAVLAIAGIVAALLVARVALAGNRPGLAFAATALTMALPVVIVFGSTYPYILFTSEHQITVGEAAAAPETLRLLNWMALPLLPVLVGFQVMSWWVFRGRLDDQSPVFY